MASIQGVLYLLKRAFTEMSYCIYWNNWNEWLLGEYTIFPYKNTVSKRTLKLRLYIWKFGDRIFSKSVYASFKLITKTNKWYPKKYFKHGGHGWKFGKKYVQKLRTSKFSRLQGALIRKKSVFRFLSYLQATSMYLSKLYAPRHLFGCYSL